MLPEDKSPSGLVTESTQIFITSRVSLGDPLVLNYVDLRLLAFAFGRAQIRTQVDWQVFHRVVTQRKSSVYTNRIFDFLRTVNFPLQVRTQVLVLKPSCVDLRRLTRPFGEDFNVNISVLVKRNKQ